MCYLRLKDTMLLSAGALGAGLLSGEEAALDSVSS